MHDTCRPPGVTTEHRHRPPDPISDVDTATRPEDIVSTERPSIARAASWLGSVILEGFALHGQAFYPCALDLPDDRHAQPEKARLAAVTVTPPPPENPWMAPEKSPHDVDIRLWLATAPSYPPRQGRRRFRLGGVWLRLRTAASKPSSCVRVDALRD